MILREIDMRNRTITTEIPYVRNVTTYDRDKSHVEFKAESPILIVIDPSKTNTGIVVGTPYGSILKMFECSAVLQDKRREDTYDFCDDLEDFLVNTFKGNDIIGFYKEKTILKKGVNFYNACMILDALSKTLQDVAREITGKNAIDINNWAWKAGVLPVGYRQQVAKKKNKGSYRWLCECNSYNAELSDDLTDSICMYAYIIKNEEMPEIKCDRIEKADMKYDYVIMDDKGQAADPTFVYNNNYSVEDNCNYFINRNLIGGYCKVDINDLTEQEIIGHCVNNHIVKDKILIVRRKK